MSRRSRERRACALLPLVMALLGACGGTGEPQPSLGWRYDTAFAELVEEVQRDSEGMLWIARSRMAGPEAAIEGFLERRTPEGAPLGEPVALGESSIAGFTVFDDGALTAALYSEGDPQYPGHSRVKLVAMRDGQISHERPFAELGLEAPEGVPCTVEPLRTGFFGTEGVRLARAGQRLVLLTYNCMYSRLTVLERDFTVVWSKDISTPRTDMLNAYGDEGLLVTPTGTIVTTSRIEDADLPDFNARFAQALVALGGEDTLVQAYDLEGAHRWSALVGTENPDGSAALAVAEDTLYLAGDTQVNRATSVQSFQDDVWLAAVDLDDGAMRWSRTLEVRDEDSATSLAVVRGHLVIGGAAGRLQVPTGSIVRHGDLFVLLTDLEGNVQGQTLFETPRDDAVHSLLDLGNEKVLVAGSKDGPITHDGDSDTSQLHRFGFVDVLRLEDLVGR